MIVNIPLNDNSLIINRILTFLQRPKINYNVVQGLQKYLTWKHKTFEKISWFSNNKQRKIVNCENILILLYLYQYSAGIYKDIQVILPQIILISVWNDSYIIALTWDDKIGHHIRIISYVSYENHSDMRII